MSFAIAAYLAFAPRGTSGLFEVVSYFYQSVAFLMVATAPLSLVSQRLGTHELLRACASLARISVQ